MRASLPIVSALLLVGAAAQAESAHFGKAATFPGDGQGSTPPQEVFAPDTPKITFAVQLRGAHVGDKVSSAWIAENATGAPANYKIDTSSIDVTPDTGAVVAFSLSKPDAGWPTGQYRIEVSFDGELEFSQHFVVKAP